MPSRTKLTAAALALSIATTLGSAPAIADTANIIWNGDDQTFYFFDVKLSPGVDAAGNFEAFGGLTVVSPGEYTLHTEILQATFSELDPDPSLIHPHSGIFDLNASQVVYSFADGSTGTATLNQVIANGGVFALDPVGNITLSWQADYRIDQVTFAYLNPVPEPETYAMLLAGLGIVGAVTRRRRLKTATI